MQALSISSRQPSTRSSPHWTLSLVGLFRTLAHGRLRVAESEPGDDSAMLTDAHRSMRCANPARSWRVLSEWLESRGNAPEDYRRLSECISKWEDGRVIWRLTEARIKRLLALSRSADALDVVAQRLTLDPHFRPSTAADTLILAQTAARGGALRIARVLLSDFGARFAGDPRVSVSEALKRRLAARAPARILPA